MMNRLLILIAAAIALAVSGCGGSSNNPVSSGSGSSSSSSSSSGGSSGSGTVSANQVVISVDSGPSGVSALNAPYASVTVCIPSTTTCTTIDHVLVDTGSYGLRILSSALGSLALPQETVTNGALNECVQFGSFYIWGTVRTADIQLAGEVAAATPVHIIGDATQSVPSACTSSGTSLASTVADLQANGILGIGVFRQDCEDACATGAIAGTYYACTGSACGATAVPLAQQVVNPVANFTTDNNGVIITLPALPSSGNTTTTSGLLTFGIGTQSNNTLGSATVFGVDPSTGNFQTTYNGTAYSDSFIDSGSNVYFLPDHTIATCTSSDTVAPGFYCPTNPVTVTATNTGFNSQTSSFTGNSGTATISIVNAHTAFTNNPTSHAFDDIGVPNNTSGTTGISGVDYGLPFFYGRSVYTAIERASAGGSTGPYWAY